MDFLFKGNLFDITENDIKNYCKKKCEYYDTLSKEYSPRYNELYSKVTRNIVRKEYSSKGSEIHRGFYCPSPVQDVVIGNCKRGRLLKNKNKLSSYGFEYGFDEKDRLIFARCDEIDNIEFIEYKDNYSIGYRFRTPKSTKPELDSISECFYDDFGRIILYLFGFCQLYKFGELKYEQFQYNESGIYIDHFVDYVYGIVSYDSYVFQHNKNGYLSSFDIANLIDKEKEDDKERHFVKRKRKV